MNEEYDVIVIGAGFGGPVAAKLCAEAGLKTLIIERSENVGDKIISGLTIPFYGFLFGPSFIRDGNPPFERPSDGIVNYIIKDIDNGVIDIDDSLKVPKPLSPIIAFGYNAYCKPFCQWEAKKALEAGAILKTSTTVVDVIKEEGIIKGIITDRGEKLRSKILIDAEGSQGLLAIKAGVRDKYPPETISLADTYDYEMKKQDIDKIFGYSVKMCWGWDEQRIAPPLGYGNGLMVWPYRNSLHFMQDQCLRIDQKKVPNLKKLFDEYHENITSKLPWWKNLVAPRIKLRARMWEGFEIYVGLNRKLRNMPNYTDGMILIGDVAGLESTELCDGVPAAWFSAKIAAEIAIEAIRIKNTSKSFLKKYDDKIKNHPIIQWSITARNRYNLRIAQKEHNEEKLKKYIHDGWGLGSLTYFTTPFMKMTISLIKKDPNILTKWIRMYFRYYQNWIHNCYEYFGTRQYRQEISKRPIFKQSIFLTGLKLINLMVKIASCFKMLYAKTLINLAENANSKLSKKLPKMEPKLLKIVNLIEPVSEKISKKMIEFVNRADSVIFQVPENKGGAIYG
ncbi:MAG: NAD(P)/FAD-dependent oxidoreductase [Promethearchaeota archaeon]|nr:MAG: NAD(P)/FAD-dependent oxidoreductase [Candidatus Lokiarchaeota archaeon]